MYFLARDSAIKRGWGGRGGGGTRGARLRNFENK